MAVKVTGTDKDTPAQALGLAGSTLLAINDSEIHDMLDYQFYTQASHLKLAVVQEGKLNYLAVEKDELAPLGCCFESYLIDKKHTCKNKCMFCFIDQMPNGLRETLYFKDDDERLSFLFGNYITLTNLSAREVERIKTQRISPINISVHTMNPELRVRMMKNKRAGEVLRYLAEFAAAGIEMNCQLVLCRGVNDGIALEETLDALSTLHPAVHSIAAVPSGLTRYREGLADLTPYDAQSAAEVLDILERYGEKYKAAYGVRMIYPGDEWFLLAQRPMPPEAYYDGYPQLENGVGMWRLLHDEFMDALKVQRTVLLPRRLDLATGALAYPLIQQLSDTLQSLYPRLHIRVHAVENRFFGGNVSVAGLLTGKDLMEQLRGKLLGKALYLPAAMLREEEDMFLDNMSVKDLEKALKVKVHIVPASGAGMVAALLK